MLSKFNFGQFFSQNKYLVLTDQALLSVLNFGSILFLAKVVAIDVFASFVVVYSYLLFIFIFSSLFISAPILVFLSKKWEDKQGAYLTTALLINFIVNILFSLGCYMLLHKQVDGILLYQFLFVSLGMTFFNVLKKFVFSSKKIHVKYAVFSTLLLNVFFFGALMLFKNSMELSVILTIYWVSFFMANLFLFLFLIYKNIFGNSVRHFTKVFFVSVFRTHYHYAKWILLGGIAFWGYTQGVYILAKAYDVDDFTIGKVRTIQNLLGVFNILAITFENHYTPIFSKKLIIKRKGKIVALIRGVFKENYKKALFLFVFAIPIGLAFFKFVYAEKYGSGHILFFMFLFLQFILICIKPITIALKCVEITKPFFVSHIIGVTGMIVVLSLFVYYKISFALPLSIMAATIFYVIFLAYSFYVEIKRR